MHELEIFIEDSQWKVVVLQTGMDDWGRGSAIVCAKNAKIAATERAENFILWIWFLRWGSLDDYSIHFSPPSYLYLVWNTSYWKHFLSHHSCIRLYQNIQLTAMCAWHFPERRALITHEPGSLRILHEDMRCRRKKLGILVHGKNLVYEAWQLVWFVWTLLVYNYDYYQSFRQGTPGPGI